jgi:hypothetical protein
VGSAAAVMMVIVIGLDWIGVRDTKLLVSFFIVP